MSSGAAQQVGDKIRLARIACGLSQEQLAHRLDRRQATISSWEQGRSVPGVEDLLLMSEIFERNVSELLPERLPGPSRSITRAVDQQLPLGSRFQGSLELFLRVATIAAAPTPTLNAEGDDPARLAIDLLAQAKETRPPVDVISIAEACGSRVIGWKAMDDSLAGLLVELEDGPLIAFNSTHPFERQRFTVAHELGHLLLDHLDTFHVDLSSQDIAPSRPGYDAAHEKAANTFAAALLMPEAWVREVANSQSIEETAKRFQVSTLAFGYRLRALGLERPEES